MYAPRVFASMIGVLLTFAVATYWITGSVYTTFLETVLCAIILQVGYFIGVLFLVGREHARRREKAPAAKVDRRLPDVVEHTQADAAARLKISDS